LHPTESIQQKVAERLVAECAPSGAVLPAGILYHDMYASDLVGTHVEMRSLEVRTPARFPTFSAANKQLEHQLSPAELPTHS